jgi:hypothetical protein
MWSWVIWDRAAGGAIPALLMRMSSASGAGERQSWSLAMISEGPVGVEMSIWSWRTEGRWGRARMRSARAVARGVLVGVRWWIIIWLVGWLG